MDLVANYRCENYSDLHKVRLNPKCCHVGLTHFVRLEISGDARNVVFMQEEIFMGGILINIISTCFLFEFI